MKYRNVFLKFYAPADGEGGDLGGDGTKEPEKTYTQAEVEALTQGLQKKNQELISEPPRVSRRPNFLREYPNEKYLFT